MIQQFDSLTHMVETLSDEQVCIDSAKIWLDVPEARRAVMRAIKGKDTKPEMAVRRLVYNMGYRYRLHRKDLPGRPDLAFGQRKKAIFVHGCFWHQHTGVDCRGARMPLTRSQYWCPKLEGNKKRDERNVTDLNRLGWDVMVVWECWLKDMDRTSNAVRAFLGRTRKASGHD